MGIRGSQKAMFDSSINIGGRRASTSVASPFSLLNSSQCNTDALSLKQTNIATINFHNVWYDNSNEWLKCKHDLSNVLLQSFSKVVI